MHLPRLCIFFKPDPDTDTDRFNRCRPTERVRDQGRRNLSEHMALEKKRKKRRRDRSGGGYPTVLQSPSLALRPRCRCRCCSRHPTTDLTRPDATEKCRTSEKRYIISYMIFQPPPIPHPLRHRPWCPLRVPKKLPCRLFLKFHLVFLFCLP